MRRSTAAARLLVQQISSASADRRDEDEKSLTKQFFVLNFQRGAPAWGFGIVAHFLCGSTG
jgi:hypothetical protein